MKYCYMLILFIVLSGCSPDKENIDRVSYDRNFSKDAFEFIIEIKNNKSKDIFLLFHESYLELNFLDRIQWSIEENRKHIKKDFLISDNPVTLRYENKNKILLYEDYLDPAANPFAFTLPKYQTKVLAPHSTYKVKYFYKKEHQNFVHPSWYENRFRTESEYLESIDYEIAYSFLNAFDVKFGEYNSFIKKNTAKISAAKKEYVDNLFKLIFFIE